MIVKKEEWMGMKIIIIMNKESFEHFILENDIFIFELKYDYLITCISLIF